MSRLYMRTSAEAHMYMDQTPCTCGDIEFDRQSAVTLDGVNLCSRYSGRCRSCGTLREFLFQLPPKQRPITDQLEYGGSDPSRLLDAGQWLGISEYYAKLTPGTTGDLAIARAALEEVLKFMAEGVDTMPDTAFWTERGRMVRDREPGRFRRARLAAILDVYRKRSAQPGPPQEPLDRLKPRDRAISAPRTQLQRLTRILEERGAPVRPVLRALEAANEPSLLMEVFALSRRLTILFPYRAEILAELAPGVSAGELPTRPMLKLFVDAPELHVALVMIGKVDPSEAVDVAPAATRGAWVDAVSAMHVADGRVSSRIRFLTQPRSTIDVFYRARSLDVDARFTASIEQVAAGVGVDPAQRERWKAVHASLGGVAVTVTTVCTDGGPARELFFTYGIGAWDEAVRLCTLVSNEEAARGAAAMLGTLAATVAVEQMRSLQVALRPGGPDVAALVMLQ